MRSTLITSVVAGCLVVLALIVPSLARADTVTDWNGYASNAIVVTGTQPPPAAVLSFAMVQGAVYDAVNAIDRGHQAYLPQPPARRSASKDAAAATAAYQVLVGLFPKQQPDLQPLYEASLAGVMDSPPGAKAGGIAAGTAAAATMLAARAGDGRNPMPPFMPPIGTTPGSWRPTFPAFALDPTPWVANVRPFVVPDVETLRTRPPNALTSRAYTRDFNEIKGVGSLNSTTRTQDETSAAIFWQDHAFALWNRTFRSLATSRRLSLVDNARLFAIENLAAADAAIGCWNNKYHWNTWRPITAIREASTDGNQATGEDPDWKPLFDPSTPVAAGQTPLVTPPFPEYPSGHNCAAGSILGSLRYFFHTDRITFSMSSNKNATTRSYRSFSEALRENINARVWAGIHFRTADRAGAVLGLKVARYLHNHDLQRRF
jgi:PAP2 superfamily